MRSRKNYSLNIEAAHAGKRGETSHFGAVFVLYLRCSTKGEGVLEMGVEARLAILTSGSIKM
jgi:hypothetical protein